MNFRSLRHFFVYAAEEPRFDPAMRELLQSMT